MEENFYKKIKDTFDNPPEYPYEPAQWEAMKERLKPAATPSKGVYWQKYGWLLLWALPFLFLGGYTLHQNNQSNRKITALETALEIEINKNNIHQSDTIFNHVVINQYDTIYHTTTVYQQINQSGDLSDHSILAANQLPQELNSTQKAIIRFNEKINQLFSEEHFTPTNISSLGEIQQSLYANKALAETPLRYNEAALKQALEKISLLSATALEIPLRDIHLFRYFEPLTPIYQEDAKLLAFMRPTGFSLGAEGSLLKLIRNEGKDKQGFTAGLNTEISFSENVSMFLGAEYLRLHYELEDNADISAYPVITPNSDQDAFNYLRVNSKYLQIPFGFKYSFRKDKDFRPYLGFGAVARKSIKKELSYEFLSLFDEYYLKRTYQADNFSINTLRGKLGVKYKIQKHWNLYFEGTYDHDFRLGTSDFEKVKYLNLRAGVLYRF